MLQLDEKNKITKGNIVIKENLLNKYSSVEEMFKEEKNKHKNNLIINNKLKELKNIDLKLLKIKDIKQLAYKIFCNYHNKNTFINERNVILVNRSGINESIQKIYHNRRQRDLIIEHLKVLSVLGYIIQNATLVNQVFEKKKRDKYISWNYYLDGITIDNKKYIFEFDVVSLDNGENHYRIQRLELK